MVKVEAGYRQCLISKKALNSLSRLKNIDSADANAMDVFKAFERYISPVARSLSKVNYSKPLIRLTSESITSAFRDGVGH